jgi:hypothetical protein
MDQLPKRLLMRHPEPPPPSPSLSSLLPLLLFAREILLPPLQDSAPSLHDQTTVPDPTESEVSVNVTVSVVVPPSSGQDAVPVYVAPDTVPEYDCPLMTTLTLVPDWVAVTVSVSFESAEHPAVPAFTQLPDVVYVHAPVAS